MAEIIAKSKAAKRQRAKEKEEDDDQLDALDAEFRQLQQAGALAAELRTHTGHMRAPRPGGRRGGGAAEGDGNGDDDFDRLVRASPACVQTRKGGVLGNPSQRCVLG